MTMQPEQIVAAATQVEPVVADVAAPADQNTASSVEAPALDTALEVRLKTLFDEAQGRAQQHYGEQFRSFVRDLSAGELKTIREEVNANNRRVTGLVDLLTNERAANELAAMSSEEQVEYYKKQNDELRSGMGKDGNAQARAVSQDPDPQWMELAVEAKTEVARLGLTTVGFRDPRLWAGYRLDLPYAEKIALMRRNAAYLAPAAAQQVVRPPVNTRGGPAPASQTVSNIADLADMFTAGKITQAAYRSGKADIASRGRAVVPL